MLTILRTGASLAILLCATGAAAQEKCPLPGEKPMRVAQLFFGRGGVSDEAWARFLAREVSPRFPDGFTVLDAAGAWRDPLSRQISRERSKVLVIAAPAGPQTLTRIADLAAAYRQAFHQRSVGIVTATECAAF